MAGLDPAIHVLLCAAKNVDTRDKPGMTNLVQVFEHDPVRPEDI